jgi:transcriptional regulator with XRE-family HTH domain
MQTPQGIIKAYRKGRELTQAAFAAKLGVSRTTVARWEAGSRKIDDVLLTKVSEMTGISKPELRPDLEKLLRSEAAEAAQ